MLNINQAEYEQRRSLPELWRWINEKYAQMDAGSEDFDKNYFKQKEIYIKKLVEEVIPVAYFGLSFVQPFKEIHIVCLAGNQNHDALLEVANFNGSNGFNLKVEVTTNETSESVFAREQLAEHGIVHRPARFENVDGKKVALPPMMVETSRLHEEIIGVALDRAEAKVASGKYDPQTAILVRVETWSRLTLSDRAELVRRTQHRLGEKLAHVHGVYYLHRQSIDPVQANWTRG